MKKRILGLMLALALCLSLLPTAALAYDMGKVGTYQTISMGSWHALAIRKDGTLVAWGSNVRGQLGNGTTTSQDSMIEIMTDVVAVSGGDDHSLAIKSDGSLWVWGGNEYGQLGDGSNQSRLSPVKIMDNVAAISAGDNHSFAIKTDGTLWAWGSNEYGQLGDGTTTDRSTPVKVLNNVSAVSGGGYHSLAIKTDGTLWGWGRNGTGQLGNGTTTDALSPVKIMDDVTVISAGFNFSLAVKSDGTLWSWGRNGTGQLGNGTTTSRNTPIKILDNVLTVSAGGNDSLAVKKDGTVWGWGNNDGGAVGNGTTNMQTTPVKIQNAAGEDLTDFVAISVGSAAMAIQSDGSLWAWGTNSNGQVGNGGQGNDVIMEDDHPLKLQTVPWLITSGVAGTDLGIKIPESVSTPQISFPDVSETSAFAESISWAVEQGITSGYGDGTFRPNETCTVAQILTFLWRAKGSQSSAVSCPFSDITSASPYYNALCWANGVGIFRSGDAVSAYSSCTRALAVTFLWRAAGSPAASGSSFNDVPASASYADAVSWAVNTGITQGTSNGTFSPNTICTRGQIVTFLYRAYA